MLLNLISPILVHILVLYKLGNRWADICISIMKKYTFCKAACGPLRGLRLTNVESAYSVTGDNIWR